MNYYYGNTTDPLFAVYEADGMCYPVFEEKYGKEGIALSTEMERITDSETIEALDKYMTPYEAGKKKIYMAGPLFNEGDRYTNQINSDALRARGYTTFLPQEIVITNESSDLVRGACFYMDLKAIKLCDIMVANCNGLEIDSGTAAEIGLAYGLQKKTVLYKSDVRNYFNDVARLNNFVSGLADNKCCRTLDEVLAAVDDISRS